MAPQVTAICKSAFYHLRKYLTIDAAQLLVHALVTSKLDYCNLLLYGLPQYLIEQLQLQFCHITPVLKDLHWLPIDLRIKSKILTIIYKSLYGLAPTYIKDLLKNYHPSRDLRSSKKNLLVVPVFNTKLIVMTIMLFLLLCHFFGTVLLSILEMLDHLTFFKDGLKLLFLYTLFRFMK